MIRRAIESDEPIIKELIGDSFGECLYLAADFFYFGLSSPIIKVWVFGACEDKISGALLKYHSGMHIFSIVDDFPVNDVSSVINAERPTLIDGVPNICRKIFPALIGIKTIEEGCIAKLDSSRFHLDLYNEDFVVEKAMLADVYSMAQMIKGDQGMGESYSIEDLINQIKERLSSGFTRSLLIKKNGDVIAQASTNAESKLFSVVSYVMVSPKYRRKGIGSKIVSCLCDQMLQEKKQVFLVIYKPEAYYVYQKIGFSEYCKWCKITLAEGKPSN